MSEEPHRRGRRRTLLGALVLVVVFGGAGYGISVAVVSSGSSATPPTGPIGRGTSVMREISGVVTRIDAASAQFDLMTRTGIAMHIEVTSSTLFVRATGVAAAFSDLDSNERVTVVGVDDGTRPAVVRATKVVLGGRPGGFAGRAFGDFAASGTVKSVNRAMLQITLEQRDGSTVVVVTNRSTTYRASGVAAPGFSAITVGEFLLVTGKTSTGGVVDATGVYILRPGFAPGRNRPGGGGPGIGGPTGSLG